ncbi:hypothetical protein LOD99_14789 [Oopsacas minuta]|uniref:Uncharacterized protein n=1 Tax=Oopsacas minuta TaxID=111878 RepID=A0AAV7KD13_9METZ|nr:hypothetical protein LOD99_14789 [Oopsacas minuta]
MQYRTDSEYCPFDNARDVVKNKFIEFSRLLNNIQNQLYDEIDKLEREWKRDIAKLQKVKHDVDQEISEYSSLYSSKKRLMANIESEIQYNQARKPIIEIHWDRTVKLFEINKHSKIANMTWCIQNSEEICVTSNQTERTMPFYLDLLTNANPSVASSMNYIDTDVTPLCEQAFDFEPGKLKKSRSTNFYSQSQDYERIHQYNTKINTSSPSTGQFTSRRLNKLDRAYTYDNEHQATDNDIDYRIAFDSNEYCRLNMPSSYTAADNIRLSRSAPHSPIMGNSAMNHNYVNMSSIKFCDPRERDILLMENESKDIASSLQHIPCYMRQQTVIKNPKMRTRSDFTESQDGIVNEMVRKFQNKNREPFMKGMAKEEQM